MAYGVRVGLRTSDARLLERLDGLYDLQLPPGWQRDLDVQQEGVAWYEISGPGSSDRSSGYGLDTATGGHIGSLEASAILRAFLAHAELFVAARAPEHLFVHAGVVAWRGRAVLMPGRSFAGKTTLVRACLDAGATYYSDEYAVLDRLGRVHPYARPLAIRSGRQPGQPVSAEALGATVGRDPLPVGLLVVTMYRPAARWRPRRLSPARALLALLDNTIAAQGDPAHSMPILRQTVASAPALEGRRGDAARVAADIAARLAGAVEPEPFTCYGAPRHHH